MSAVAAPDEFLDLASFYARYEDQRAFLLDGRVTLVAPPLPPHSFTIRAIGDVLRRHYGPDCVGGRPPYTVCTESALETDRRSDPEPDLAVLHGTSLEFLYRHPRGEEAVLVVEVADSSLRRDRRDKLPHYAGAGVAEYGIANLVDLELEVYRDPLPAERRYQQVHRYRAGDRVTLPELEVDVDVGQLLPPS